MPEEETLFEPVVVEADTPLIDDEGLGYWFRLPRVRSPGRRELYISAGTGYKKELRRSLFTAVLE